MVLHKKKESGSRGPYSNKSVYNPEDEGRKKTKRVKTDADRKLDAMRK